MKHPTDDGHQIILPDGREIVDEDERYVFFESLDQHKKNWYKIQRESEYPPITDYIDGVVKGDQEQIDAYIDACRAIKEKYPKPI